MGVILLLDDLGQVPLKLKRDLTLELLVFQPDRHQYFTRTFLGDKHVNMNAFKVFH